MGELLIAALLFVLTTGLIRTVGPLRMLGEAAFFMLPIVGIVFAWDVVLDVLQELRGQPPKGTP